MTAAQELFEALKNARPGPNYVAKVNARAVASLGAGAGRTGDRQATAPMFAALTPGSVELPALGGCVELIYEGGR